MNFATITLGELLSSHNETIKRNAFSILKQLQKERDKNITCPVCDMPFLNGTCKDCDKLVAEL